MAQELDRLWISIAPKYIDRQQADAVKKDVKEIDDRVERLGNTLAKVGAAFVAFGTIAVKQFSDTEAAISEFAGKAGMRLEEFEARYDRMSKRIARTTGVTQRTILQGLQEGVSMGLSDEQLRALAPLAARLHAGNQADMATSLTAAAAASKAGFGTPADALRTIYATAQVGSGAVADYGQIFKMIAPYAGEAGVGMNLTDSLGALAAISERAPSLSMGGTWMRSFLIGMLNPKKQGEALLQSRTGQSFSDLRAMMEEEGGMAEAIRVIKDNFSPDEMFKLFGREEAVSFLGGIDPDYLADKIGQVIANTSSRPIEGFWSHFGETFATSFRSFQETVKQFMEQFGEPLAWILKQLMDIGSLLLAGLTKLDKSLGGAISWIATLVGSIAAAVFAFKTLRFFFGGRMLDAIGNAVGSAVGTALGVERPDAPEKTAARQRKGWFEWGTLGSAFTAAFASVVGFWRQIRKFFGAFLGGARGAREAVAMAIASIGEAGNAMFVDGRVVRDQKTAHDAAGMIAGGIGGTRGAGASIMIKAMQFMGSTLGKILIKLTVIGAVLTTFFTLFRWATRDSDAAKEARARIAQRRQLRTHLQGGGTLADAPLPGEFDSLDIQAEQAEAVAERESRIFWDNLRNTIFEWLGKVQRFFIGFVPNIFGLRDLLFELQADFEGWLHEFIESPFDVIRGWFKEQRLKRERAAAGLDPDTGLPFAEDTPWWKRNINFAMLNQLFGWGDEEERKRLQAGLAPAGEGQTPIQGVTLTSDEAKRLGLEGLPSDWMNSGAIDQRPVVIPVPHLPTPLINSANDAIARGVGGRPVNVNVQQTINVNGSGDPERVARQVMSTGSSFMQRALEEAMQQNESPIER